MITSVTSATMAAASDVGGWAAALGAGGALFVIGLLIALELLGTGTTRSSQSLRRTLRITVAPLLIVFTVGVAAKALAALST